MSTTAPHLHVVPVEDEGPEGPWLHLLDEPAFDLHIALAAIIAGLVGMLAGAALTIVLLRTLGAL